MRFRSNIPSKKGHDARSYPEEKSVVISDYLPSVACYSHGDFVSIKLICFFYIHQDNSRRRLNAIRSTAYSGIPRHCKNTCMNVARIAAARLISNARHIVLLNGAACRVWKPLCFVRRCSVIFRDELNGVRLTVPRRRHAMK